MPHIVIFYTSNLDRDVNMSGLCRSLADTLLTVRDEQDKQVFPSGGTRVFAYPAPHFAVSDGGAAGIAAGGDGDYGFLYMNLRMARGRSADVQQRTGKALEAATMAYFAPVLARKHVGVTIQIDEGHEVFDAKNSSLHPLFAKP